MALAESVCAAELVLMLAPDMEFHKRMGKR